MLFKVILLQENINIKQVLMLQTILVLLFNMYDMKYKYKDLNPLDCTKALNKVKSVHKVSDYTITSL